MTPDQLRRAGMALFGPTHWQTNLAMLLVGRPGSKTSRIRNWLNGETIPAGVRSDLIKALRKKAKDCTTLADKLVDENL